MPWNGAIGLPFSSTEVSIRGDAFDELPVWTGEGDIEKHTGELCVRGPQVMKGYWKNLAETAKVMKDGWLKTGDIGHIDGKGFCHHHRSQEGHDPGIGVQRLPERGRKRGRDPPRRT